MRIRQAGLKRQSRGITMFGMLIGIIVLITAVLPAIRSVPSLMEYQAITRAVKQARERAATREEVMEMLGVCMYMGGGPAFTYAAQALEAFDSFASQD